MGIPSCIYMPTYKCAVSLKHKKNTIAISHILQIGIYRIPKMKFGTQKSVLEISKNHICENKYIVSKLPSTKPKVIPLSIYASAC